MQKGGHYTIARKNGSETSKIKVFKKKNPNFLGEGNEKAGRPSKDPLVVKHIYHHRGVVDVGFIERFCGVGLGALNKFLINCYASALR
jgi:hypothetical protein